MSVDNMSKSVVARNRSMDTIRFLLIAAVMAYHYTVRWRPPHHANDLYQYNYIYNENFAIGAFGVQVFFMISGFFIAIALEKYSNSRIFLYRRVQRIYPAFVVSCTLTFALMFLMPLDFQVGWSDYLFSLGLVAENLGARFVDGAYWSLAVELKFYFFVFLASVAMGRSYWIGLIGLACAGALIAQIAPKAAKEIFLAPYMPMFLGGIGLAYHTTIRRFDIALALYVACVAFFVFHLGTFNLNGPPSRFVAFCVAATMVVIVVLVRSGVDISFGPSAYLGLISYEIYLLHQKIGVTIIRYGREDLGLPDLACMLLAASVVIALAAFVHEILQRPIQAAAAWFWSRKLARIADPQE